MFIVRTIGAVALAGLACGAAAAQTQTGVSVKQSISPSISQSVSPSISRSVSPSVTGAAPATTRTGPTAVSPSTNERTFEPQAEQVPGPEMEPRALNEARQPMRERDPAFNRQGRLASPNERREIQRGLTVDRLRNSQRPGYSVGAGNNIIRRW